MTNSLNALYIIATITKNTKAIIKVNILITSNITVGINTGIVQGSAGEKKANRTTCWTKRIVWIVTIDAAGVRIVSKNPRSATTNINLYAPTSNNSV